MSAAGRALGGPDELIALLRQTPFILRALLDRSPGPDQSAGDDGWTIAEVVGHLIDVERRAIDRIALLQAKDRPVLDSFDPAGRVAERGYRSQAPRDLFETFAALRDERIAALESLDEQGWERAGVLESGEAVTLRDITIHMCRHDVDHLAQIARIGRSLTSAA